MCDDDLIGGQGITLAAQLRRFIGSTVTIFTTSGGASGAGFTGVLLSVNATFVRLVTDFGMAPISPLSEDMDAAAITGMRNRGNNGCCRPIGSEVDIPIDRIAAFAHNSL
jgi:hypothetical protein